MSAGARAGSPVARLVAPARDAARFLRNPLALLGETAAKGDLSWFRVGPRRFYLVNDLDLIEEVLATRHGPLRRQGGYEERRFAGDSLFSEEEPVHGERRRVLEPVFDPEAIESYGAWMGRRATEFARAWPAGGEVNVAEEMDRLTLGIMTAAEFGERAGPETTSVVADAFRGSRETFGRVRMPHAKLLWALPLPAGRRYLAARRRLDDAFDRALAERQRTGGSNDLLSRLLRAQRGNGAPRLTDVHVRAEGWSYLAQGAQAITLTWAWALLGRHPEAERRLHAEVDALGAPPTTNELPRLRYADALVYEALRLYPPVWTIARVATAAYPLGDMTVPKGSVVLVSPYVTQRDARWWPDPLRFHPERWLDGGPGSGERRAFLAYGAGQRACLGRHLVHLQCVLVLAAIARHWRLRLVSQPQVETFPFLQARGGLVVRLERRA